MSTHGHGLCADRTSDVCVPMDTTFPDMHLINEKIREGLKKANFIVPSPIQRKALPRTLCGYDTIFKAKSGTGKTAVFAITALQSVMDLESNQPQVLIIAPTREIAVQIVDVIKTIGTLVSDLKVEWFIGGTDLREDVEKLHNCRIVVGALGRIAHLIDQGYLSTKSIRLFVVDEADQMIQASFRKDFNFIFNSLPESKQVLICSATFTLEIIKFLSMYMTTFCFISGDQEDDMQGEKLSFASLVGMKPYVSIIDNKYSHNSAALFKMKMMRLDQILKTTTFSQCLIFTNYISSAKTVSNRLCETGFVTAFLCSEQTQTDRLQALEDFKQNKSRVLVTTDIAARGIDVQNVDTVINFEVPIDEQTYLHRMGRAGRYGSRGVVITLAADGPELTNLKKILNTIKSCVAVLPSRPPFVDAADIKVQESKLKEISGENGAQSCVAAVSSESNFVNGYILRKNHLKEIYGAEMEDISLEHFKEDILHHVKKLTERTLKAHKIPLCFEVDTYYLLSKTYTNFHPQLVAYVENIVFDSSQFKNLPLSDQIMLQHNKLHLIESKSLISNCDLKENICPSNPESSLDNQSRYKTVNSKNDLNETHFCETNSKFNVDLVLRKSYLQRLYSVNWAEDININQFQLSIEKDFERLKCISSDFSAELEQRLSNTNLLRSSNENINSNVEQYYCLCKTFKKLNQNLVQFVESKLNEQKMKCIREIGALITSPKVPCKNDNNRKINGSSSESSSRKLSNLYSSNIASVGIALAPNVSKKKQVPTKTPFQKDSDNDKKHPVTKYLYLKQNLLKRLYQATKVSKDFCIETFRHSIEPSFSQLRSSNLSPETTSLLRQIDIFKHPMEGLNNHTVQVYFQFCRHFHYLNPDLVASISKKVERIEAGLISEDIRNSSLEKNESSEDKTLKTTGCIPAEVLSCYFSDRCKKLNDLEIDEAMKKKIMSKISVQTDLENKIGQKLFVEQSLNRNFFLSYFKLCQTFKDFDLEFISYVKDEVEKMPNITPNVISPSCNDSNNDAFMPSLRRNSINTISSEASESNSDMQHTTSIESLPVESDTSSALTESTVTHSYKELSGYPPCESASVHTTKTLNAELKSTLCEWQQSLIKTAENDKVYFKSEREHIVPTVFNFLKGSKETTLKDVERFSIPANVRAGSDSLKQSKNYGELLHSYQTFKVSDNVTSAVKRRPQNDKILDEMTKKEIQSFYDSVEDKAQNRVSFSDTVVLNNEATASNSLADIMEPTPIGFANLSSQEISLVSGHTSEFNFPGFHESEFNKSYQGHFSSIDTTDQVGASMSNNHQDTKREAKKVSKKPSKKGNENEEDNSSVQAHSHQGNWMSNKKIHQFPASPSRNQEVQKTKKHSKTSSKKSSVDQEDDSSDWVTASSAESGSDEEGPSMPQVLKTTIPKNSTGEVLNLCDRCKSWYRSTGSFEFSDIADKTRKSPDAKIPKKMQSKKSSKVKHPSGDHDSWDSRVPSYEQLIQWYNMWYQQIIFSQQFVWYNEYLRNMSSED